MSCALHAIFPTKVVFYYIELKHSKHYFSMTLFFFFFSCVCVLTRVKGFRSSFSLRAGLKFRSLDYVQSTKQSRKRRLGHVVWRQEIMPIQRPHFSDLATVPWILIWPLMILVFNVSTLANFIGCQPAFFGYFYLRYSRRKTTDIVNQSTWSIEEV